jgi:hypothetical protein
MWPGLTLASCQLVMSATTTRVSRVAAAPLCLHAVATTPAGLMERVRSCCSISVGLPSIAGGSAPALHVSGPTQRSLTLRPACSPSRLSDPLHQRLRRLRFLCRRSDCFYEKVIKVKADVAALLCLISVLIACGTSGPHSLRLLVFLPFLFFVAFATFPHKIWR